MNFKFKFSSVIITVIVTVCIVSYFEHSLVGSHNDLYVDSLYENNRNASSRLDSNYLFGSESSNDTNKNLEQFVHRQKEERNHIKDYCLKSKDLPKAFLYSRLIYDKVNNLGFCPVYKAASTSWGIILLILRGKWDPDDKKQVSEKLKNVFATIPFSHIHKADENRIKFIVVRHPFERLLSAYRDKIENANKLYYYKTYGEKIVKKYRPKPIGISQQNVSKMLSDVKKYLDNDRKLVSLEGNLYANPIGPTFLEFVKFVVSLEKDDEHWVPIYKYCALCQAYYDIIIRFESITSDTDLFLQFLGKSEVASSRWDNPTKNGSTRINLACEYFSQLNKDLFDKLFHKYQHDFGLFQYSSQPYLECLTSL